MNLEDFLNEKNIIDGKIESNDSKIAVEAPYAKVDVVRPADLVEEILRVYGFNNIAYLLIA